MNRRGLLIAFGLIVVAAAAIWWFRSNFHQVSETIPLPRRGEASYNPLYALKRTLQTENVPTVSHAWLTPADLHLPAGDTLVLYSQPVGLTPPQIAALLAWVGRGGHLVTPSPNLAQTPGSLMARLGLRAVGSDDDDDSDCEEVVADSSTSGPVTILCGSRFLENGHRFALSGGDPEHGYRFGRMRLGAGTITVCSDLDFLDNDHLERPLARELSYQLLAPRSGHGGVTLIYSSDMPSLLRLILRDGWPAVLPAMLALFAWLALRNQRFGPLTPMPAGHRRALLEHVRASGEFAFRRGRGATLHAAVLNLFRQRLRRREPVLAALVGEAQALALAEHLDLPAARVRTALAPIGLHRPDVFVQSISTLIQMRNRL